jgi:hypothetical protein
VSFFAFVNFVVCSMLVAPMQPHTSPPKIKVFSHISPTSAPSPLGRRPVGDVGRQGTADDFLHLPQQFHRDWGGKFGRALLPLQRSQLRLQLGLDLGQGSGVFREVDSFLRSWLHFLTTKMPWMPPVTVGGSVGASLLAFLAP